MINLLFKRRQVLKRFLCIVCITAFCLIEAKSQEGAWPAITNQSKPWARWWWMGNAVDTGQLALLMKKYHEAGIGGLEIAPIYGVKGYEKEYINYLSPQWMQKLRFTLKSANELGMGIDLTGGTGWPFGGPQIKTATAASQIIVKKYIVEKGNKLPSEFWEFTTQNQQPLEIMAYDTNSGKTENLINAFKNGKIPEWTSQKENKTVYAVYLKNTGQKVKRAAPGGEGLTLDHFSANALDEYLYRFDTAFKGSKLGIRAFFNDSYEVFGADWTPNFFETFKKRRGYDLRNYLPEFFAEYENDSIARIKSDYRETVSELLMDNFTKRWTSWAHNNKAITRNQAHGSPANLLDVYAAVDIPEIETFGSSNFQIPGFTMGAKPASGDKPDPVLMKFPASAANITGKKLVSSETFTWLGEHFQSSLAQFKPEVEQCFLYGVNHVFYHGITYSPTGINFPGWLAYASVNMVPDNSWWPHVGALNNYITKVQSLLQASTSDNEVLLYWPVYDLWHNARGRMMQFSVHNFHEKMSTTPFYQLAQQLNISGYSVDFISDLLLNELSIKNGKIVSNGGATYKAIIIPNANHIPLATLEKLIDFSKKGASVIFQSWPRDIPGFGSYDKRRKTFDKISEENNRKTKKLRVNSQVIKELENTGIWGEKIQEAGLQYLRRKYKEGNLYYLVNHSDKNFDQMLSLQSSGKYVMLLDPQTGKTGITAHATSGSNTDVRIQLLSGESIFVWFVDKQELLPNHAIRWLYKGPLLGNINLINKWNLSFKNGGPVLPGSQILNKPGFWTDLPDSTYSNFSGTGVYSTDFHLDSIHNNGQYELVVQELGGSAKVIVNDMEAGIIWSVPYKINIDGLLRPGKNKISIEVANLMANRIRFMDRTKIPWKNFHDINIVDINYKPFDASGWKTFPSGVSGNISIQFYKKTE